MQQGLRQEAASGCYRSSVRVDTIRFYENAGNLPGWTLYTELFENEDAVYLELEGVQVDVIMIDNIWGPPPGTVVLRLPTATARQLGLVSREWTRDGSW
ncbi:UNVERIFIED_ORG: hypothetical protein BDU10_7985 [Burkholderia sp. CF145]|nr:hypothetical protein PMI06_002116 [Burkholderia sp. BT03]SKD05177.1 hypothetical protein SAMN06266956_8936 [Paraburkholderia hospita]